MRVSLEYGEEGAIGSALTQGRGGGELATDATDGVGVAAEVFRHVGSGAEWAHGHHGESIWTLLRVMHVGREFANAESQQVHRWYKYRHLDFFSTRSSSVISEAARKREVQARAALGAPPPLTFNGAREEATKASRLGISQAWSVDHLDAEIAQRNREALVEVARVLKQYPELRCEVHGETSTPHSGACDPDLAGYFGFDAETDLKPTMDELAKRRAEACPRPSSIAGCRGRV